MSPFLIVVLIVLAILVGGLMIISQFLEEFEHVFVYLTWGMILFIVGGAVYLTLATPTFANPPLAAQPTFVAEEADIDLLQE